MRRLVPVALLGLLSAPAIAELPPSLDRARMESCAPATIEAATDCLRASLSAEDAARLVGPNGGGGYRGFVDSYLRGAWNLTDPETPLARDMRARDVYDRFAAPSVIIANLAAKLRGATLDWRAVAAAQRRPAIQRVVERPTTQEAPHGD